MGKCGRFGTDNGETEANGVDGDTMGPGVVDEYPILNGVLYGEGDGASLQNGVDDRYGVGEMNGGDDGLGPNGPEFGVLETNGNG